MAFVHEKVRAQREGGKHNKGSIMIEILSNSFDRRPRYTSLNRRTGMI
jgi:hypothetical protein